MPTTSTILEILVKLNDQASAAMQSVASNIKNAGKDISAAGKTMTTDVTLPLAAFAAYAAKGAMDFQQAMTLVQTQAGASATEVADLSKQVMDLATHSQQGPTELANGLYHLISLGLSATDAMKALKVSSEGAAVGQEDLEAVTNALGGAISSGIKGTSDYAGTMGALDAVIGAGNMKMGDLVAALGTGILPAAKSAGLALNDVGAAIATMTDNGIPAEDAATRLRMTFSLMSAPTKEAQKALHSIGISSTELADDMRQPNGLLKAIMDLKTHLEDSGKSAVQQNAVIAQAFGGGRTSSAIETLLEETDKLSSKYTYLATNTDKFSNSVNVEAATWQGQLQNMNANLEVFRDSVGTSLLQIANQVLPTVTNALQDLVQWWNSLSPSTQKSIIYVGMFAAAIGPVLVVVGTLISAIGSVIGFLGGFVSAIGTVISFMAPLVTALGTVVTAIGVWPVAIGAVLAIVVALIITHWTQVKNFLKQTWDQITALMQIFLTGLQTIWNTVWGGISQFFIGIWDGVKSSLSNSLEFLRTEIGGFVSWASGVFQPVMNAVNAVGSAASGFMSAASKAGSAVASVLHIHDAIITPGGQVIQSDPQDYLIATKTPGALAGAGNAGGISITINGGQYYTDRQSIVDMANKIAKIINRQLKLQNYA